jgi:hypothetical protein
MDPKANVQMDFTEECLS